MAKKNDYCESQGCEIKKSNCRHCEYFLYDCDEWRTSTFGKIVIGALVVGGVYVLYKAIKNQNSSNSIESEGSTTYEIEYDDEEEDDSHEIEEEDDEDGYEIEYDEDEDGFEIDDDEDDEYDDEEYYEDE